MKFNSVRKKEQDELHKADEVQLSQKKEQDELHKADEIQLSQKKEAR